MARKAGFNKDPHFLHAAFVQLASKEEQALSLLKPYDVREISPQLIRVKTKEHRDLWNYFRVVISSAGQGALARGQYRAHDWFVFDKNTKGLLGLISFADIDHLWEGLFAYVGGPFGADRRAMALRSSITRANGQGTVPTAALEKLAEHLATGVIPPNTMLSVLQLKRCLPTRQFGVLTGGKLLALVAGCTELIECSELEHSRTLALTVIKTLHGRSSQYNRLHPRGLVKVKDPSIEVGAFYAQPLRAAFREFLLGQTDDPGARLTFTMAEQVDYWKTRWLPNRIALHSDNGMVAPCKDDYRLSVNFMDKIHAKPDEGHDDE